MFVISERTRSLEMKKKTSNLTLLISSMTGQRYGNDTHLTLKHCSNAFDSRNVWSNKRIPHANTTWIDGQNLVLSGDDETFTYTTLYTLQPNSNHWRKKYIKAFDLRFEIFVRMQNRFEHEIQNVKYVRSFDCGFFYTFRLLFSAVKVNSHSCVRRFTIRLYECDPI